MPTITNNSTHVRPRRFMIHLLRDERMNESERIKEVS
jgi:hypothetical protein